MEQKSVAELVILARDGSADARDDLVRRHYREAIMLAASMVNDPTEGEDLAQEAFIRAFRNLDLLVDPNRFDAWLRRIVVGLSFDWLRAFRPALFRGWSDGDEATVVAANPSPLELLLRAEMSARVRSALAALPPRYRAPIRMYHLDGLSHAKIASALDIPVGTVRSLVARARRRLKPLFAEYVPESVRHIDEVFQEQTMTSPGKTRFLHVANGTCTTMIIEAAGIPGARSIWADPLYEGPVPGGLSDDELLDVRAKFLSGPGDLTWIAWAGSRASEDPINDLREWRAAIARHEMYEELILWFEHDLFDQLNLVQLLQWIEGHLPKTKPVSLICIGSFPGRPDFRGLGELTSDELASLLETRQAIGDAQYMLARRTWHAFRDQRRGDHTTRQPLLPEIAIEAIAAWSSLVDEPQLGRLALQAADQLVQVGLSRANGSHEHRHLGPPTRRVRDGDRILVHVQTPTRSESLAPDLRRAMSERFMKKTKPVLVDDLRAEYDFASMKGGVRGKYVDRAREGTNVVLIEPEVADAFPTEQAVNEALKGVLRTAQAVRSTGGLPNRALQPPSRAKAKARSKPRSRAARG